MRRTFVAPTMALAMLAPFGVLTGADASTTDGRDDVTVVAVIDSGFNPYHWDFLASKMPQAQNTDPSDDLPLTTPPHEWIPGFPDPSERFASYRRLDLTLSEDNPFAFPNTLQAQDAAVWSTFRASPSLAPNYHWIPGTKIVGAISFGSGGWIRPTSEHGVGSSSVSVGNLWGSCPECVAVLIQYNDARAAIQWASQQPWIDAITNSYGSSTIYRENVSLAGSVEWVRDATVRGQATFWSAGNGQENAFVVPNHNLHSSQKGPDWIITVGAISPSGSSYSGAGKTVDLAGVGSSYPAAYQSSNVSGSGSFSGTSNATPTIAGTYGRALYLARRALSGPSSGQAGGVIATGDPIACGSTRSDCELGDGMLTSIELRNALFSASVPTPQGMNVGGAGNVSHRELELASEGRGGWFVRQKKHNTAAWLTEFDRLWKPLVGEALYPPRPPDEHDWLIVDSYCRQQIWGPWNQGEYRAGVTELPAPDPAWPLRSSLRVACERHPRLPLNP